MNRILALCALFLAQQIQAATYYVDFDTGSDSNNGTSTATPWKHEPGDVNATGTADSTVLAAGDTVKFKGGVVYYGGIVCTRDGSWGNPITYDGNYSGDWGTGRAIIDRQYTLNADGIAASAARSHLVIRGFEIRNCGGWADDATNVISAANGTYTNTVAAPGNGVNFSTQSGHTNIYVGDLYIHRMGGWRNTAGWEDQTISGGGVFFKNSGGITITNCEMTKMQAAMGFYSQSGGACVDNLIVSNYVHNYITWGIDIAPQSSGSAFRNITIKGNRIWDYAEFVSGNWAGVGEWPHTDGMFIRNAGSVGIWTNVNVFHNSFLCNSNRGDGGTASIYVSQGPSVNIYSNLFFLDSQTRFIGVEYQNLGTTSQVQVVYITNNTFIGNVPLISSNDETNTAYRRIVIRNNVFLKTTGTAQNSVLLNIQSSGSAPYEMDNNIYYDPDWSVSLKYIAVMPATGYSTFSTVQGSGFEASGAYSNPLLTDTASIPSLANTMPQAGSPAVTMNAGWLPYVSTIVTNSARAVRFKGWRGM